MCLVAAKERNNQQWFLLDVCFPYEYGSQAQWSESLVILRSCANDVFGFPVTAGADFD